MSLNSADITRGRLPIKQCSGRFCIREAPATEAQIVVVGDSHPPIIGYCQTCERYVCDQCSLRETIRTESDRTHGLLLCLSCGSPLGTPQERLVVDDSTPAERVPAKLGTEQIHDFYRESIRAGRVATTAMRQANVAHEEKKHEQALEILRSEVAECKRVRFDAGLAAALDQLAHVFMALDRHDDAVQVATEAEAHARRLGDERMIAGALLTKYVNQSEDRDLNEKLADLDELERAADGVNSKIVEFCDQTRAALYFESGQIAQSLRRMLKTGDSKKRIATMLDLLLAQANLTLDTKPRPANWRPRPFEEGTIKRMATTHNVWACPNGCRLPGMVGWVGQPKGTDGSRMPCFVCGANYICINKYSALYASVPDRPPQSFVQANALSEEEAEAVALFNMSLCFRMRLEDATAAELQQLAIEVWAEQCGEELLRFALSLNHLARALQDRDEHEEAVTLLRRAAEIAGNAGEQSTEAEASIWNNLGLSLACLGQFDEGEEVLRRACELREFANPNYWLAKLYSARAGEGDPSRELAAWREFLRTEGGSEARRKEAEHKIAQLEGREVPSEDEPEDAAETALANADWLSILEAAINPEKARKSAETKVEELRSGGPSSDLLQSLHRWYELLKDANRWEAAAPVSKEMVDVAEALGDVPNQINALAQRTEACLRLNNLSAALAATNRHVELAEQNSQKSLLPMGLNNRAVVKGNMNQLDDAIADGQKALQLFLEDNDVSGAARMCTQIASLHARRNEWPDAIRMYQTQAQICRSRGETDLLLQALLAQADIHRDQKNREAALRTYEEVEALARQNDRQGQLFMALYQRSQLLDDGEQGDVRKLSEEAADICKVQVARLSMRKGEVDPTTLASWRHNQRLAFNTIARAARKRADSGHHVLTKHEFERLRAGREKALEMDPDHGGLALDLAEGTSELAMVVARSPDPAALRESVHRMLQAVETMESVLQRREDATHSVDRLS